MTSDAQSQQSEYSRRHRQGVATQLREIRTELGDLAAIRDELAELRLVVQKALAERPAENRERPQ